MDDNRKLAEEIWRVAIQQPGGEDTITYIAAALSTYGAARYRAGVEAMRDAAHPLMRWPEDHEGLNAVFARLLEAK